MWSSLHAEVESYRVEILVQPRSMNEEHNAQAALTFLFQLALVSPDRSATELSGAQLVQLLDKFSIEFIQYFGYGAELADMLFTAFNVPAT